MNKHRINKIKKDIEAIFFLLVLPKFEVTVDLPPYGLTTDLMFHGTVKAK